MSVADPRSVAPPPPAASPLPAVPAVPAVPHPPAPQVTPAPAPARRAGRDGDRALAIAFAVAWLVCPIVEPMPGEDVHIPLWQVPIEIGTLVSIVAAVIALWRGSRHAPRLGLVAGAFMAVMTMVCPLAGHTPVGWWTWVQAGMSLAVMATSAALHGRGAAQPRP